MDAPEQSVNVGNDGSRSGDRKPRSEQIGHLRGVELNVMDVAVVITAKLEFKGDVLIEVQSERPDAAIVRERGGA